jgi:protein-tyrosine kinase
MEAVAAGKLGHSLLVVPGFEMGPQAEAIRAIATRLIDSDSKARRRGLAVVGVADHEGATFVAANLAVAIAQAGYSTLLVDADLADPELGRLLGAAEGAKGLSDLLADPTVNMEDVLHRDILPGLSAVYAGTGGAQHEHHLRAAQFERFIDSCMRDFDYTIVDTPAANLSADAMQVVAVVGYAMVVARRDHAFADDVATLVRAIEETGAVVAGTVLNRA